MMVRFDAIGTQRRYQIVAETIRSGILRGDIPPGTKLPPERDLSQQFAVSRPTVREALIALEIMGLVEIRAGAGVFVNEPVRTDTVAREVTGPGPFELLEVRRILEGEIAALIAPSISDDRLEELEHYTRQLETENARGYASFDGDRLFHEAIAAESQNSAVVDLVRNYWEERTSHPLYTRLYEQVEPADVRAHAVQEHRLIIKSLRARSPEAARRAMQRHIARVMRTLLDRWKVVADEQAQPATSSLNAILNRIPDEELGV